MEKICKYCSNYNKGKCSILNEKLSTDISFSYWGVLNIIENFFNDREIFEVKNGEAFSKDSPYMLGETILDGQQIPFQVSFGLLMQK